MDLPETLSALKARIRRPAFFWGVIAFYLGYLAVYFPRATWRTMPAGLWADTLLSPLVTFTTFAWLSALPWQWNGRRGSLPGFRRGLLQALVFLEAVFLCEVLFTSLYYRWGRAPMPWSAYLLQNFFIICPLTVIFGNVVARREAEEFEKHHARSEARAAQTRLLQSQLHPHVLFNALNGVAELILKDPPAAERVVRNLSDLLRQLLEVSESGTIPLHEERRMVENYLAIESMRLGDRLDLQWDWREALDPIEVIPLLLQPLVENAIKHGVAPREEGGTLRIRGSIEGGSLRLEVWNSGEGPGAAGAPGARQGIGLKNLRARLASAYGDAARFTLEGRDGGVMAVISIDALKGLDGHGRTEGGHR